jgi:uncharacterized phage protein (TIGR02218 family)
MRNIGTLATHVQQTTTTLAVCWRLVTQAGQEFGFTSCSRDLVIDGLTYYANSGMEPTSVECSAGLAVDNSEVVGFVRPGIIEAEQLRAGLFDGATVYKFLVNYDDPDGDQVRLIWGVLGEVQVRAENQFNAEMRGGSQWLAANIVPLTQATCRAAFGDPVQCKAIQESQAAEVTGVDSRKLFSSTDLVGAFADGLFDYGYIVWTAGSNAGLRHDVRHYDQANGSILLVTDAAIPIEVGDEFTVYEGCAKTRAACKLKSNASGVNNILNFDGEPDIPGNDVMLRIVRAG